MGTNRQTCPAKHQHLRVVLGLHGAAHQIGSDTDSIGRTLDRLPEGGAGRLGLAQLQKSTAEIVPGTRQVPVQGKTPLQRLDRRLMVARQEQRRSLGLMQDGRLRRQANRLRQERQGRPQSALLHIDPRQLEQRIHVVGLPP